MSRDFFWPAGVSREAMLRTLPVLGIHVGPDTPFRCVLPGHGDHDALIDGDTFAYRCFGASAIYHHTHHDPGGHS